MQAPRGLVWGPTLTSLTSDIASRAGFRGSVKHEACVPVTMSLGAMILCLCVLVMMHACSAYKPMDAKACCQKKCSATRTGATDCSAGCRMWMAHSSLNWENATWHGKLYAQCTKDCSNWRRGMRGHVAGDAPGSIRSCNIKYCGGLAGDFIEHVHPFAANIEDLFECNMGCTFFAQCKAQQPPGKKPKDDTLESFRAAEAVGAAVLNAARSTTASPSANPV